MNIIMIGFFSFSPGSQDALIHPERLLSKNRESVIKMGRDKADRGEKARDSNRKAYDLK